MKEVERLALDGSFDYILIESTGIGEPVPVAQTFTYIDEQLGIDLTQFTRLDTMVTVVDAAQFWRDFYSKETLKDRGQEAGEDDVRGIVHLLTDQVEFCDVLVLNKCDLVSEDELSKLEKHCTQCSPRPKCSARRMDELIQERF